MRRPVGGFTRAAGLGSGSLPLDLGRRIPGRESGPISTAATAGRQVGANLCVIGDPDQAIYGFRGADRRYFLTFHEDYPDAETLHLRRNYRSTQTILDAATQVIDRSPGHEALDIWSEFVEQIKLDIHDAPTDKAEAEYVVHQIEQMVGGTSYFSIDSGRVDDRVDEAEQSNRSFADFAVLYRTSAQVSALREALDRSGIPYQTSGQTPLYAQKETRLILAHLWLLLNPFSSLHLDTLLNHDRPLFPLESLETLMEVARSEGRLPWEIAGAIHHAGEHGLCAATAYGLHDGVHAGIDRFQERPYRRRTHQNGR